MTLCYSYMPDYFSVVDILVTEERIACKVQKRLSKLGYLDASSEDNDLKVGTKLELPFWLAYQINTTRDRIVSIDIPKVYKEGFREILQADANAVRLIKWNPYYYELGMYLCQLDIPDAEKILESLLKTFRCRFRVVMDWAQNPTSDSTLGSQLPRLERDLFAAGKKSKIELINWLKTGSKNIETSELVTNLRKKRKRSEYESN